ncbi:glycoside hydrolase family 16 protein [Hydnomerulius pinastri MD-312]|uniref:Unplaced genomic scaffold scaffold_16, whole genome shotgun sequence n=1 Tax=Hydnomerulius pinastri MD-312 TaxID=994086 RepID=A0A0C9WE22_9AGAM|nr:glycoside hydrolase family 16 protein [Hydnomerulius pinastri MD-312]
MGKSSTLVNRFLQLGALASLVPLALCATYTRTSSLAGNQFIDAFTWQTIADPVHGRVNYVNESTAQQDSLVSVHGDRVVLRADSTTTLDPAGPGRNSFRLVSNDRYTTHVAIAMNAIGLDLASTSSICLKVVGPGLQLGVLLLLDPPYTGRAETRIGKLMTPRRLLEYGKIDIIEGVNDQTPNLSSLHTSANCTMPDSRLMTGTIQGNDCSSGSGCGVDIDDNASYGPPFNLRGGGCLTFCGDWAGSNATYTASGCPSTCVDFVNQNPTAFSGAYFEFNRLSIYQ